MAVIDTPQHPATTVRTAQPCARPRVQGEVRPTENGSLHRRLADGGGDVTEGHLKCLSPLASCWWRSCFTGREELVVTCPKGPVPEAPTQRDRASPNSSHGRRRRPHGDRRASCCSAS